jgi:hypothetical protein
MNARHAWATVGTILALVALYLIVMHPAPVTTLTHDVLGTGENTLLILQGRSPVAS